MCEWLRVVEANGGIKAASANRYRKVIDYYLACRPVANLCTR